jgi:hypothetical protein
LPAASVDEVMDVDIVTIVVVAIMWRHLLFLTWWRGRWRLRCNGALAMGRYTRSQQLLVAIGCGDDWWWCPRPWPSDRGGAGGAPYPPKTNLGLRPCQGPVEAFCKGLVFLGSRRLNGGVQVVEPRQHPSQPDLHHGIIHWIAVHRAARRLYENARGNILQLAASHVMQEYARSVLSQNMCWAS